MNFFNDLQRRYSDWYQVKNAEYYRSLCPVYGEQVFRHSVAWERVIGKALKEYYRSVGNYRCIRYFPEIHMSFIGVDTYMLRSEFDRRDVPLKEMLLNDLRGNILERVSACQYDLSSFYDKVVSGIWKIGNTLVIAVPYSCFFYCYPACARVLASSEFIDFIKKLQSCKNF